MVLFRVLSGKQAGATQQIARLPLVIGRHASVGFRLEEEGVLQEHLRLDVEPGEGFILTVLADGLAVLNGHPLKRSLVRNGDVIQLGAATVQFWLSATRQRSYQGWENALWVGLAAFCAAQILLIYQLLR